MNELEFVCAAMTTKIRREIHDFAERLAAGQSVVCGDDSMRVTLDPAGKAARLEWITPKSGARNDLTVPYCLDGQLEDAFLEIGMTLAESRRVTTRARQIEAERRMLIEQHGGISQEADDALELASRSTMSGPYRRRAQQD